ncbi:21423_t:CDS:2, partial [Dentiscutata erythropus]
VKWMPVFLLQEQCGIRVTIQQGVFENDLLENKVFLNRCQEWLQKQSLESRSPKALKMHIEEYDERKKGVYYDGHERPDVVAYRKEWLERMFRYKMYIKDFVGDMLEIVIEPELESDERELVQVTHNECYFYTNDGQLKIWTRKDEDILRPKHMGHFIIVLTFMCQCHGLLQLSEEQF